MLRENLPSHWVEDVDYKVVYGDFFSKSLQLRAVSLLRAPDVQEYLYKLSEYPIMDASHYSNLRTEAESDHWVEDGRSEMCRAIRDWYRWVTNDHGADIPEIPNTLIDDLYYYIQEWGSTYPVNETGSDIYLDCEECVFWEVHGLKKERPHELPNKWVQADRKWSKDREKARDEAWEPIRKLLFPEDGAGVDKVEV